MIQQTIDRNVNKERQNLIKILKIEVAGKESYDILKKELQDAEMNSGE